MERVKVLHLITHLGFGGALDNTLYTVKGHSRARYEVHLAAGEIEPGEDYKDWSKRAQECADQLFIFPSLRRSVRFLHDTSALRQITDFMRQRNYHIVHTHTAKAGILGRVAARRAGVPIVIHTFHAFAWQVTYAARSAVGRDHFAALKERLYVAIERYAASLSDALITVAELNKREAIQRNIAPPEKFTTIYSGIDMERFVAFSPDRNKLCQTLGLDPERPIVGMVGRLSPQKAPLDFIRAAETVLQHKPDVQFILVGDGPLEQQVKRAVASEQRIKLTGFVDNVPELLSILDVFALSSLWEGLGRALTEAMIMNVPVAATCVGGVPELVVHKETGLLSPPGNIAELAKNIHWLLDHPEGARAMSARARERVISAFSGKQMVEQIEALYERLLVKKQVRDPTGWATRRQAQARTD